MPLQLAPWRDAPGVRTLDASDHLRARLDAARPDPIVMAAGDHLNQWFMDNCRNTEDAEAASA
ncbi:hypothetical protein G5C60_05520 [Streptomyces sp. HC44]|uniref:Uncharacterized protein n=1 Tax=Streptomyces scabichelini TaxID=2711217 RepID=A0A6G4UZU3_9ACTN|nr:hypothetical protein [Streptomyces scabichelini]NGO07124.1 hypothetical protein [Streptomyces scabichelini]